MARDCCSELAPTHKVHVKENKGLPSAQPAPRAFGEVNSHGGRNAPHPPSPPPGMSAGDKQAAQHPVSAGDSDFKSRGIKSESGCSVSRIPKERWAEPQECHGLPRESCPLEKLGLLKPLPSSFVSGQGEEGGWCQPALDATPERPPPEGDSVAQRVPRQHPAGCALPVTWWGAGMVSGYGSPRARQGLSLASSCPNPPLAENSHLHVIPKHVTLRVRRLPWAGQAPSLCSLPVAGPFASPPYPLPRPHLLQPPSVISSFTPLLPAASPCGCSAAGRTGTVSCRDTLSTQSQPKNLAVFPTKHIYQLPTSAGGSSVL